MVSSNLVNRVYEIGLLILVESECSLERVNLDLRMALVCGFEDASSEISHLVHIPNTRSSIDILAQVLSHLFHGIGNADKCASSEIQTAGAIIFGDRVEDGTYHIHSY